MWINIAANKKPNDVPAFFEAVKAAFPALPAGAIAEGSGGNNLCFIIDAPDDRAAQVANQLTMALMPSRWSNCEGDPMLKPGEFYDART